MLMRFGEACDAAGARHSQAKAYLGAVVVWLYAGDAQQAWQVRQQIGVGEVGIQAYRHVQGATKVCKRCSAQEILHNWRVSAERAARQAPQD